jgi:hypothetical protein
MHAHERRMSKFLWLQPVTTQKQFFIFTSPLLQAQFHSRLRTPEKTFSSEAGKNFTFIMNAD